MQTPENDGSVRFLYGTALGRGLLKMVQTLHLDRVAVWYLRSGLSKPYIVKFARKNGIPLSLVFTKADKESQREVQANMKAMKKVLLEIWEELPPIYLTSSLTGMGRDAVLDSIEQHHATHQFAGTHLLPALHTQVRVFRSGSGHADIKNGIQSFFFQAQDTGHHLGQAGRRTAGIRILFINHAAGAGIDQNRRIRLHVRCSPHLRAVYGSKCSGKNQIS